jgi:tetratricopeptide (TPR) repeat protein/TolB-like protein
LKRPLIILIAVLLLAALASAQSASSTSQTLLLLPFENASKVPGLEWIGEAFPEVMGGRMASPGLYVVPREDRMYAFDRSGIPTNIRPSHATLFRIGEQMDVDYMVLGQYTYDGQKFSATAQLLDVKNLKLTKEMKESGPLTSLIEIQTALAWDILHAMSPDSGTAKNEFIAGTPPIRLDAFENYIRGITAISRTEKIKKFKEAVRLNPQYTLAMLQLGRTYFAGKDYEPAVLWFAKIPRTDAEAREASFYTGLSYYFLGEYDKAESAFKYLESLFPLTEVYNNLGVVAARRGRRNADDYFQKAVEADPNEADYHFNLGLTLYRSGDMNGAARQLREAVRLRPSDTEAKAMLDAANGKERGRVPLERIKRNYDETSFRQLMLEIQNTTESRLAKSDPRSHAAYHVEHGHTMLAQNFIAEAGQEFREAISLDSTSAGAHSGLAAVLEASNDHAGAKKEAWAALKLQPLAEAYVVLAKIDLRENNASMASQHLQHALQLEPANAAALALQKSIASGPAEETKKSE